MMGKKCFTLIELLAVIVVLAIIALIATPMVMNIIKGVQDSAAKRSAENYLSAVETAIVTAALKNPGGRLPEGSYEINDKGNLVLGEFEISVPMQGKLEHEGFISIYDNKIVYANIVVNKRDY